LGLAGRERPGAVKTMLLDQPVNFTHNDTLSGSFQQMQVGLY
jgi:hypothetical protein